MGKLFGTDGIRGIAGEELTAELAFRLGLAVSKVLTGQENKKTRVIIGKDTRLSGDMFEAAITAGLCAMGSDVYLVGVVPTPAVAFLVREIEADAGIMISASHNPSEYNGIKVFGAEGYKLSDALEEKVEELILSQNEPNLCRCGSIGRVITGSNLLEKYERHLISVLDNTKDIPKRRILFDLSNGSASSTAKYVFSPEHTGGYECDFIAYDPDGININRNCGSTQMNALCRYVVDGGYDIGIAFDGDADRCLMCDENGKIIDGDMIISAFAVDMKKKGKLDGNTAVVTKLTNLGFHQLMKKERIQVTSTDVGDRYVLEEMLRSGAVIGGEQSGHIILRRFATTGDGQITAAVALNMLAAYSELTASEIFEKMERLPQVSVNVTVPQNKKKEVMESSEVIAKKLQIENLLGERGRILLRPSGTEALIRIMLEGNDTAELNCYAEELKAIIEEIL